MGVACTLSPSHAVVMSIATKLGQAGTVWRAIFGSAARLALVNNLIAEARPSPQRKPAVTTDGVTMAAHHLYRARVVPDNRVHLRALRFIKKWYGCHVQTEVFHFREGVNSCCSIELEDELLSELFAWQQALAWGPTRSGNAASYASRPRLLSSIEHSSGHWLSAWPTKTK